MGLSGILNFYIFAFSRASDLKFCTYSSSSCVYHMVDWFRGSNGKVCEIMASHSTTLFNKIKKILPEKIKRE